MMRWISIAMDVGAGVNETVSISICLIKITAIDNEKYFPMQISHIFLSSWWPIWTWIFEMKSLSLFQVRSSRKKNLFTFNMTIKNDRIISGLVIRIPDKYWMQTGTIWHRYKIASSLTPFKLVTIRSKLLKNCSTLSYLHLWWSGVNLLDISTRTQKFCWFLKLIDLSTKLANINTRKKWPAPEPFLHIAHMTKMEFANRNCIIIFFEIL